MNTAMPDNCPKNIIILAFFQGYESFDLSDEILNKLRAIAFNFLVQL